MSDRAANTRRRANWVGLRTLRQRPKVVGETAEGEPIFEVRSVRLVLGDDVSHFNRILACARCGREVFGMPVLTPADLDHPPSSVICKECVRAAGPSSFWSASRTAGGLLSRGGAASSTATAAADGPRPREVTLSAPVEAQPGPAIVAADGAVDLGRFSAFQSRVEERLARLTELLEIRSKEVGAAVDERLDEAQSRVDTVTAGQGQLVVALERVEQRVNHLLERRDEAGPSALHGLVARVGELSDQMTRATAVQEQARAEISGVDGRLAHRLHALDNRISEALVSQRYELEAAAARVEELTLARAELARRLDGMADTLVRAGEMQRAERRELHELVEQAAAGTRAGIAASATAQAARIRILEEAAQPVPAAIDGLVAVQAQLNDRIDRSSERAARQASAASAAEERMQAALERVAGLEQRMAQGALTLEELARSRDELTGRVADVAGGMVRAGEIQRAELREELREQLREEVTAIQAEIAAVESAQGDRIRILEAAAGQVPETMDELNQRLDRLSERAARQAQTDRVRHDGLERQLVDALDRERSAFETAVSEARTEMSASVRAGEDRVQAVERQTAEFVELQAALDSGLGELRAELVALGKAGGPGGRRLSEGLDALEGLEGRGGTRHRPFGRGWAEVSAALASLSDLVQRLSWRHDQLEMRMGMVEEAGDQATGAVARQLAALRKELKAQSKALDALSQTVESLPRPRPRSTRARKD